jgi:hypothetical protein
MKLLMAASITKSKERKLFDQIQDPGNSGKLSASCIEWAKRHGMKFLANKTAAGSYDQRNSASNWAEMILHTHSRKRVL